MEYLILIGIGGLIAYFFWAESASKRKREALIQERKDKYLEAFRSKDFNAIQDASNTLLETKNISKSILQMLYRDALTLIRQNPDAKAYALYVGRKMYSKGRKEEVPTVYDESAIQNDIIAAS